MSRSASQDIARYLQSRVKEWVGSGKTARMLAQEAKISEAQVSDVQNTATGVGWKTAESLARAFGMTMTQLIAAAEDWAAKQPAAAPATRPDANRRRTLAAELAREDGVYEEAIASVMAAPVAREDEHLSTVGWVDRFRLRQLEMMRGVRRMPEGSDVTPVPDESGARPVPRDPSAVVKKRPRKRSA